MKDRHGNDPDRGIIGAHLVPPPVPTPPPPPPPSVVVKKYSHTIPVNVISTDDDGRPTVIQCPARGCGEPAPVDADGRVRCPHGEAELAFIARAIEILERDL